MKGLLIKDFLLIKKHNISFLFVWVLFFGLSLLSETSMYFSYYSIAMISLMSVFTMAYDENSKWNRYEAILPIKESTIVLEKYILVSITTIPFIILETLAFYFVKELSVENTASLAYLMIFIGIICPAVTLPINFRFGYLKGKLINFIVIAVMAASVTAINMINSTGGTAVDSNFKPQADAFLFAVLAVILFIISFGLSVVLYRRREF